MNDIDISIITMIFGILGGAIIGPAIDALLQMRTKNRDENEYRKFAFAFLCAGNACGLIGFFLLEMVRNAEISYIFNLVFFLLAILFFTVAWRSFLKPAGHVKLGVGIRVLSMITLGNLIWVLADSYELILRPLGWDQFPQLIAKYIGYGSAFIFFSIGAIFSFKIKRKA